MALVEGGAFSPTRTRGLHADDRSSSHAQHPHPSGAWIIPDVTGGRAVDVGTGAPGPDPHGA
jgi:hypothetical protein